MASVRITGDNNRLNAYLTDFGKRTLEQVEEVFEDAAYEGVDDIRTTIETTRSGIVPGKPNRVWTGNMRDSVSYETETSKTSVKASWGWLNIDEEEADYIFLQEYGGERVSFGMKALFHSFIKQFENVKRGLMK